MDQPKQALLKPAQRRAFHKAIGDLNRIMREIQAEHGEASYLMVGDRLHLVIGPSHGEYERRGQFYDAESFPENIALVGEIVGASSGEW